MENLERSEKWDKTLILPLKDNVSPVYICVHFNLLYVIIGFSYSSFLRKPFYSLLHVYIRRTDAERTLVGLMLKLKHQYFGHLMWTKDSLEKSLMLGKIEGRRRRGCQRMRWLDGITGWTWTWTWANSGRWWGTGRPGKLTSMGSQRVGQGWLTEQQQYIHIAVSPLFPQLDHELLMGRKQGFLSFTNFCKHSTLDSLWGTWLMRRTDLSVQVSQQVWVLTTKESVHC